MRHAGHATAVPPGIRYPPVMAELARRPSPRSIRRLAIALLLSCLSNAFILVAHDPLKERIFGSIDERATEPGPLSDSLRAWSRTRSLIDETYCVMGKGFDVPQQAELPLRRSLIPHMQPVHNASPILLAAAQTTMTYRVVGWPFHCAWGGHWFAPADFRVGLARVTIPQFLRGWSEEDSVVIPTRPIWYGLLADLASHAALWSVPLLGIPLLRRRFRGRLGRCTHCNYDLHATPPDQPCPECGAFKPDSTAMSGASRPRGASPSSAARSYEVSCMSRRKHAPQNLIRRLIVAFVFSCAGNALIVFTQTLLVYRVLDAVELQARLQFKKSDGFQEWHQSHSKISDVYTVASWRIDGPGPAEMPLASSAIPKMRPLFVFADPSRLPDCWMHYTIAGWPLRCAWGAAWVRLNGSNSDLGVGIARLNIPPSLGSLTEVDHLSIPYRPLWSGLVVDLAAHTAFWSIPLLGVPAFRRHLRRRRGHCPTCNYDLRGGVASGPCPECGGSSPTSS